MESLPKSPKKSRNQKRRIEGESRPAAHRGGEVGPPNSGYPKVDNESQGGTLLEKEDDTANTVTLENRSNMDNIIIVLV